MGEPMCLAACDTVFCEASPEQRQRIWQLNGEAWARPLNPDVYIERQTHMSEQEFCRDGRQRFWILHLKGYPRQIIASCDTISKTVLISENGSSREGKAYGVASVYTNPEYRRQGMAAILLRRVQEFMDKDSELSVLYSDIGRNYYANLGWHVFPSKQATLSWIPPEAEAEGETKAIFAQSRPGRTRYLRLEELADLCEVDELHLSARFDGMPADNKTHIAFLPSYAQISWQLARADFMADKLFGKPLPHKGAIADNGRAWIYWEHYWRVKVLRVLRIVCVLDSTAEQRIDDTAVLLEAALAEASAWGLSDVVVWNPDEETTAGSKAVGNAHPKDVKVVFEERLDKSIPSLRWAKGQQRKTVWEDNDYYGWC